MEKADARSDVLRWNQTGKTVDEPTDALRNGVLPQERGEMRALLPEHPVAADNTVRISEKCDFDFGSALSPAEFSSPL
jgi:DNA polymerase III alpha subunit